MSLTLSQFLFLVLTFAAVIAVIFLVIFLNQLKRTAREGEKTLIEIRDLVENLQDTSLKVNDRIDDVGKVLNATSKAAVNLSEASWFLSSRLVKPSSKYWPFIFPVLRMVMRHWRTKRKKEDKNGE